MSELSPRLGLPLLMAAQAQKHVTHNEALLRLDLLTQLTVLGFGAETPPASPAEGEVWALGPAPAGDWAGAGGALALWFDGAWHFVAPAAGWRAGLGSGLRIFDGSGWVVPDLPVLDNLPGLGVNAAFDGTNRLTVAAPATLLNHDGADHRLKLNKAVAGDTASVLFQTGFSGRAEMGTAGSDDWSIRVSPDGAIWHDGLTVNRATGAGHFPNGLAVAGLLGGTAVTQGAADDTPGRLLKVGDSATLLSASPALRAVPGGTANAITLTSGAGLSGPPPAGLQLRFRAGTANIGAATIALDGGTPVACRTVTGVALPGGYLRTDADTLASFDGTFWVLDRQIARGSNANGEFTRFADGTQICWNPNVASVATDVAATGAIFRGDTVWTFPATFLSGASVNSIANSTVRWGGTTTSVSTIQATIRHFAGASSATTTPIGGIAIGRWY